MEHGARRAGRRPGRPRDGGPLVALVALFAAVAPQYRPRRGGRVGVRRGRASPRGRVIATGGYGRAACLMLLSAARWKFGSWMLRACSRRSTRRPARALHSNLLISLPRAVLGCLFFLPCLPVCRAGSISRIWSPCRRNDHYGFTAVNSKHNDKFKRARDTLARAVRSRRRVTRRGLRRSGSLAS